MEGIPLFPTFWEISLLRLRCFKNSGVYEKAHCLKCLKLDLFKESFIVEISYSILLGCYKNTFDYDMVQP